MTTITSPDMLDEATLAVGDVIQLANGEAAMLHTKRRPDNEFDFFWRTTASTFIAHPLPENAYPIRILYSRWKEATK
ncbi:hypothetical protein INS90_09775 [Trueperella pecoris]|uniref:Uncharacterized protein n=1 Tax=Trueperella pecoris TaxID=2733571 RepID=A0A7M1QZT7_9ACTO|nr:hypothetical protein [Trueperella pecoris]QOR47520.1 hypothetical protein INS90_09775 [Trueperella pecoris]